MLTRAERLYGRKKLDRAAETLNDVIPRLDDKATLLRAYRLLAFVAANMEKLSEAESAAMKALEIDPDDRDCHFALSYIFAHYKDYDKCRRYGEKFLRLYDEKKTDSAGENSLADDYLHLLHNYLGLAWQAADQPEAAIKSFRRAIKINKTYNHPYLNLATLYQRRKEYDLAAGVIEEGLKKCSQVQELRILKNALQCKATISACMMVKNEEELLPGCLKSIRSWVDEIIVVDTGSTDSTIEIARSYGAQVFEQEWSKDFSKHRNYSISKATSDWVFIIDADEEFVEDDLADLRKAVNQEKYRIISMSVLNMNPKTGEYTSFLPSPRLFRRDAGFKYEGIVHNQLRFPENEPILRVRSRIKHYGYNLSEDKKRQKIARSRELLEKQLIDRPDDPFVHFNYAQLLRGITAKPDRELADLILKHAARAVELSDPDDRAVLPLYLQGLHQQATTNIALGNYQEAVELCRRALEIKPDYLDALYTIGEACGRMNRYDESEKYFNEYLIRQKVYDPGNEDLSIIMLYGFMRHRAYYSLGLLHQIRGNLGGAEKYYMMALDEQDPCLDTYLRLADVYLRREEAEKALEYIEKELSFKPASDMANLYKSRYYALAGNEAEAGRFLDRAVELTDGNADVYEMGAVFRANRGEYDRAAKLFELLVQARPDYPEARRLLAKNYFDMTDFNAAVAAYEKYLELVPDDAETYNDLANCYFRVGDYENAEKYYAVSLNINENLAAVYRNLGLTRLRMNKLQEALPLLENYIKISPEDIEINLAVGSIYKQLNRFTEALPHFEKYLMDSPNNIEALFNISECYFNLGYAESAAIGYLQVLKINPDFQPAKNRLAEIQNTKTPA